MSLTDAAPENPRAIAGDNLPPPPTTAEILAEKHADLIKRFVAIRARFADTPLVIETQSEDGKAAELGLDATELFNDIDEVRKTTSEPFRVKVAEINAFFATYQEPLKQTKKAAGVEPGIADTLAKRVGDYKDRVATAERRRQNEIATQSRLAAQRHLDEAAAKEKAGREVAATIGMDIAESHERRAEEAEARAAAPIAELTRTRTASGVLSTAGDKWTGELESRDKLDLNKLRPLLSLAELTRAIKEWAKKNPGGTLAGARIFRETKAQFRR